MSDHNDEFVAELRKFSQISEKALESLEKESVSTEAIFSDFRRQMFRIHGMAQQLNLPDLGVIAKLGEELAHKGSVSRQKKEVQKCVSSLWDILSTVKYMVEHNLENPKDLHEILLTRLQHTLQTLGGPRPILTEEEIEAAFSL